MEISENEFCEARLVRRSGDWKQSLLSLLSRITRLGWIRGSWKLWKLKKGRVIYIYSMPGTKVWFRNFVVKYKKIKKMERFLTLCLLSRVGNWG